MRSATHTLVAVLALWLAGSPAAWAQARSSLPTEAQAAARESALENAARPALAAARAKPYLGGYWRIAQPVSALMTEDGQRPPLNAAGLKALRSVAAQRKAGANPDPMDQCLPPGTPRSLVVDKPFLIAHAAAKVTFFHQVYHVIRHVYLDGPLQVSDADRDEFWEGTSAGHWDGDTLVIETANFNGRQWLDDSGLPQSTQMRVTERLRRIDADTLENRITYADATYYSKAWTTRLLFKAQPRTTLLVEEDCAEKLLDYPMKPYAPE